MKHTDGGIVGILIDTQRRVNVNYYKNLPVMRVRELLSQVCEMYEKCHMAFLNARRLLALSRH